jgi:integrase
VQRGSLKAIKFRGVKVWRAQWREQGKGRTKILGRCADVSRGDARAELDRIVAAVNNREVAKSPKVDTLRQYTENEYLVQKTRKWKASTASTTECLIEAYLLRQVGSRPLNQITRRELQVHLDSLAEEGRSASVVKHVRFQLQAIFAMAKGDGLITVDPTNGLVNPRCKRAPDKTVLNLADFARALMVLEIQERLIFQLALYEGMRPGEIVGLQMGDMAGDELRISRRIYAGKVDEPKSKRSWRPIPLTRQTGALLGQYLALTGETRSDAWLFPSETGNSPLDYSNVWRRRIGPELSKIGLAFVNFQVLRRTWATEFDPDGTNPHTRAALAGHSVDVSENVYRQTKPEDLRRAVNDWSGRLPLGSGLLQ